MGLATAKVLALQGARVSLADLNGEGLKAAVASLQDPERHMTTVIDVRKSATVDRWIADTVARYGRLDGAVNMAGVITKAVPIAEQKDDAWDLNFEVNTRGVFFCLRAQINAMKEKGGSIVRLSPISLPTFAPKWPYLPLSHYLPL